MILPAFDQSLSTRNLSSVRELRIVFSGPSSRNRGMFFRRHVRGRSDNGAPPSCPVDGGMWHFEVVDRASTLASEVTRVLVSKETKSPTSDGQS